MSNDRIFKRAKILATVGPASHSYEMILGLIKAGVNGFRFNFAHGSYEERDQQIAWIRQASAEAGKPVAIVQDLLGPKLRISDFESNGVPVTKGQEIRLVYGATYHEGDPVIPTQFDLSHKVREGERLYLWDGKIATTVIGTETNTAIVRIDNDGLIKPRKGINVPDTDFGGDIFTEKDMRDLDFGASRDIDYVAISFVQRAADMEKLRQFLKERGSRARTIAKIETALAIQEENLEGIVMASDGLMVARGDLAVEAGLEVVPVAQRRIMELACKHEKLCIVATQMLLSMTTQTEPTRAEVSDVANAVIMGADCLMLSEETANGQYPLETVATMKKVIMYVQERVPVQPLGKPEGFISVQDAVSAASVDLAHRIKAKAIICETKTGATARAIASRRPAVPIISVTSDARIAQQLTLLYANKSYMLPEGEHAGLQLAKDLRQKDVFEAGSPVVLVSSRQPGMAGGTDTIRARILE